MEVQCYEFELHLSDSGLGLKIRENSMPLVISKMISDGPAATDGRLNVGDQIIEINDVVATDLTHSKAIELIKNSEKSVKLRVIRGKELSSFVMGKFKVIHWSQKILAPLLNKYN